ncbi:C40 family peptidase [Candidatus Mycalebacterium sp.]
MKRFSVFAVLVLCAGAVWFSLTGGLDGQKQTAGAEKQSDTFVFTYTIMSGDSLNLIARRFGITTDELSSANVIDGGVIYRGNILSIPLPSRDVVFLHTVAKGETVSSIASAYGTSVRNIMKLNRMKKDNVFALRKILVNGSPEINSRFVVFRVGSDDEGSEISRAFGVDEREIEVLNAANADWRQSGSHIVVDTFEYSYPARTRDSIIETAKNYLGAPYKYGGNSPETGIDCSAYVKRVFSYFGANLPRTVRMMHKHADGRWVNKDSLQKGDLVFFETDRPFPSHIGIYIEDGRFIHASSAGGKVIISDLAKPYYSKAYIGAKRIYLDNPGAVTIK